MSESFNYLEAAQGRWGEQVSCDSRRPLYAATIPENLFLKRLTEATETEFRLADGSELRDTPKRPAKMRALMSSSALTVNFFDTWRERGCDQLGFALGLGAQARTFRFEYVCKSYPVTPRAPNLDLLVSLPDRTVAVEAKFAEPFRSPGNHSPLAAKYFESTEQGLWDAAGLVKAQAVTTLPKTRWKYLNTPQLLKHMLGLARDGCARTLLYLWYDTGLADARHHAQEIQAFGDLLRGDAIEFRVISYQEVFRYLERDRGLAFEWKDYMARRYFSGLGAQAGESR